MSDSFNDVRQLSEHVVLMRSPAGQNYIFKEVDPLLRPIYRTLKDAAIPGIPKIMDISLDEGKLGILEEYISGPSLQQKQAEHPLSRSEIVHCMDSLAATLEELHAHNIVHGDIKAQDIILGTYQPYLLDFESAKFTQPLEGMSIAEQQKDIQALGKILEQMDQNHLFEPVVRKALNQDSTQSYTSVTQFRKDLHKKVIIIPGLNNPTNMEKVFSILGMVLLGMLLITSPSKDEVYQNPFVNWLASMLTCYLMLAVYCNRDLIRDLTHAKGKGRLFLYCFGIYIVFMMLAMALCSVLEKIL